MSRKGGLGTSLGGLLSQQAIAITAAPKAQSTDEGLTYLNVLLLKPGKYQPRTHIEPESLQELADSIKQQGVIQPLVVRLLPDQSYEIVAGERRWRAAQQAGLKEVPCMVRVLDDESTLAIALIENIQREDLNALEEATALKRLIDEFGLTQQELADAVGKSRAGVANLLRLLSLEPAVKRLLERGDIEMGHARALLSVEGKEQEHLAQIVVQRGLTVRQTEVLTRKHTGADIPLPAEPAKKMCYQELAVQARKSLGTRVDIKENRHGGGKIVIAFDDAMALEEILGHLKHP
jgi:ParB family chromosome partitioning protein